MDQSLLQEKLDAPSRKGDLFYIQKLVSVIETSALSSPSPSPSPSPSVSGKPGDISGISGLPDGKVDIWDYNQLLTDFGKTGTGLVADIEQFGTSANKVDIFDYNLLLTNFGK